ncbi:uncharacterized protein A4U43_C08F4050 [Asparagus officinalis]|nr:uncharacterized protein A4U43_C08F4050 [Asparagus officinalis]
MWAEINGVWNEEKHSAFLNWMEKSFVMRMPSRRIVDGVGFGFGLPLDRVVPDSDTESNRGHLKNSKEKLSESKLRA